ncbi:MAG TPA: ATP-dependent RecD-like DNA helicase, partial [Chloroflexota bacterium]|nr:ATP-dependent RecD-like DNA helicase [Chloroflexota bacterium]
LVTVVGTLADLTPGEAIVAHGWWRNDPKHGWQFMATDYRTTLPATIQGIRKYLGSGLVKGVGPVNAGRIVDAFGEATFEIIDTTPERLITIKGIGPVRAGRITTAWVEQRHIREVMATLQGFGLSTSLAVRIYKQFGDQSGMVLTKTPYRLAREVWGIGFKTADTIARAVGIAPDAPERIQAGVLHALGVAADLGHTLLPEGDLLVQAADLLGVEAPRVEQAIEVLRDSGEVVAASGTDAVTSLYALAPFARAESGLASRLQTLAGPGAHARAAQLFSLVSWPTAFRWLAERHSLRLAPEQEAGVQMVLTCPVSILTGGPGTGKTHTLRAIMAMALAKGMRCVLAAPTGRAAKRMTEATGHPAGTLHRILELRPGGQAGRGPEHPLNADLVIVDETSMLDVLLANQLVKALAPGTHLLLVGDPDQLPSVGAGDVLADLLRVAQSGGPSLHPSAPFPVTRLQHIFRQGAGSGIALNARRINAGEMPRFGGPIQDCFFLPAETPAEAAQTVVDLVSRRLPSRFGFRPGEVQVLSPMHRGEAGVGALNALLQERLNPARPGLPELRGAGRTYRPGDRVLQLKNDYDLKVFNGDLGTVLGVDAEEGELRVALDDGREVRYPASSLYALTHAFSISVHKGQGAEFPAVVIPLLTSHAALLGRTLLYTAVTRARRLVVIVGQWKALSLAVHDWRREPRYTALQGLLDGTIAYRWPPQTSQAPQVSRVSRVSQVSQAPPAAEATPAETDLADLDPWEGLLAAPAV